MKNSIITKSIFALGALVALWGCSKDEAPNRSGGQAVRFTSSIASRAHNATWDAGDKIGIYMLQSGATAIENRGYVTNLGNEAFTPIDVSQTLYYPMTGTVNFIAYYPYDEDLAEGSTSVAVNVEDQTVSSDIDLLWASATDKAKGDVVSLGFTHKMSRLRIDLKKGAGMTDDDFEDMTAAIAGLNTAGTMSLTNGVVTATASTQAAIDMITLTTTPPTNVMAQCQAIVLPETTTAGSFSVAFDLPLGEFTWKPAAAITFQPGKSHDYLITVDRTGITSVTATITDWIDDDEGVVDGDPTFTSVWDGTSSSEPELIDDTYYIYTAAELNWVSEQSNLATPNTFAGKTLKLMNDIDLAGYPWTPIGDTDDEDDANKFAGTFDGNDHKISNLYIDATTSYEGLFGWNKGTITNLHIESGAVTGTENVGGVCGMNEGNISGCSNAAIVKGYYAIGGVCGQNTDDITDCYNTGAVSGIDDYIGGVCGYNFGGTVSGSYNTGAVSGTLDNVGGVCGQNYEGDITGCYNTGTVSGRATVGGICGFNNDGGIVSGCDNFGAVSGTDSDVGGICGHSITETSNCNNSGNVSGVYHTGGVCGGNNTGVVTGCSNSGAVSGTENIGGVCGVNSLGEISGCENSGKVEGTESVGGVCGGNSGDITDCNNTGAVSGTDSNIGGVSGDNFRGTVSGSYNSGEVNGTDYVGGVCGKSVQSTITDCYNTGEVTATGDHVGGVCGWNNAGPISGCYNTGEVTATGDYYIGGVCGQNDNDITDCYNTGEVTATGDYVGGVCGWNFGSITDCNNDGKVDGTGNYIGGVCGYNFEDTVSGCYNTGDVTGTQTVGGVCGWSEGSITGSYNEGVVSGDNGIGGVFGESMGDITGCYNTGAVNGNNYVGGVGGINYSIATACYNTGAVNGNDAVGGVFGKNYSVTTACYSTGTVTGVSDVGGVCGNNNDVISNCYWANYAGNGIGTGGGTNVVQFSETDWPAPTMPGWGIGNDPSTGKYWESLGSWNGGNPTYPTLSSEETPVG